MAELINEKDSLNDGRKKLNKAIEHANDAKSISEQADNKATQALSNSESTQEQLNQVVIDGDSSVEAAQARVDKDNHSYSTLKERLDTEQRQFETQLAETDSKINIRSQYHSSDPIVTFSFDDAPLTDITRFKPIFDAEGITGSICVITDRLNHPDH